MMQSCQQSLQHFVSRNCNALLPESLVSRKNYIAEIRADKGFSLELVAERAGTSHQQISNLEKGKRRLTWEWIQRLAVALECHPSDITDGPTTTPVARNAAQKKILDAMNRMSERDQELYAAGFISGLPIAEDETGKETEADPKKQAKAKKGKN